MSLDSLLNNNNSSTAQGTEVHSVVCVVIMQVSVTFQFTSKIFNPTDHFTNVQACQWEYTQLSKRLPTGGMLVNFTHNSNNFFLQSKDLSTLRVPSPQGYPILQMGLKTCKIHRSQDIWICDFLQKTDQIVPCIKFGFQHFIMMIPFQAVVYMYTQEFHVSTDWDSTTIK